MRASKGILAFLITLKPELPTWGFSSRKQISRWEGGNEKTALICPPLPLPFPFRFFKFNPHSHHFVGTYGELLSTPLVPLRIIQIFQILSFNRESKKHQESGFCSFLGLLDPKAHKCRPTVHFVWDTYIQVPKGCSNWTPLLHLTSSFWPVSTKKPHGRCHCLGGSFEISWHLYQCLRPSIRLTEFPPEIISCFPFLHHFIMWAMTLPHTRRALWGYNHISLQTHEIFTEIYNSHSLLIMRYMHR